MNSADIMQAKLERLGDKIANLKAQGICSHGWLKTLPGQQKTTCLDCGATFDSFEQALNRGREILQGEWDMLNVLKFIAGAAMFYGSLWLILVLGTIAGF